MAPGRNLLLIHSTGGNMRKIRIVGGRNGRLWPEVLETAAEGRREGRPVILYVPEQLTLQTERDLITGLKLPGLLDTDVISPKKLRRQVQERAGTGDLRPMTAFGRSMAIHRAMTECADELAYYRGTGDMPGAVSRVREALDELQESGMTADELARYTEEKAEGAEKAKLSDLCRIRETYAELAAERFEDEKTAWTRIVRQMEQYQMWAGTEVLVYGFDSIRPDLRELLAGVSGQAARVTVFLMMDRAEAPDGRVFEEQRRSVSALGKALEELGGEAELTWTDRERDGQAEALQWLDRFLFAEEDHTWTGETGEEITLFAAAGPAEEAADVAETLQKWHREGTEWHRMAVALPAGTGADSILQARLKLSGIPFFCTEKTPAASHGVCRMLLSILRCLSDGYQTDDVADAAQSGFSTLTDEEAYRLENYATAHGINRNQWQAPFTRGEDAAEMEELRSRLLAPAEELRENLKKARNAAESVEAVVRFLEAENVWNRLKEREEQLLARGMYREAVVDRQVWQLLMELLDQLWALLGQRRASIRDMRSLLETALDNATVAVLPEHDSGVEIGEVGHMLAGGVDALVLTGVQEGILAAPASGWLTDRERAAMENATGREIGASRERRSMIRRCDYYRTLSLPEKRLRITRSLRDEKGAVMPEDGLIGMLRRMFPSLKEEGSALEGGIGPCAENREAAAEEAGVFLDAVLKGENVPDRSRWEQALVNLLHDGTYERTVSGIVRGYLEERGGQTIEPETAQKLFITDQMSISRLEGYAACPYRHFIDYGLRPVQRETFDFEASDAGTFFHEALDRYMRIADRTPGWPDISHEETDRIMDRICGELTAEWTGGPLKGDALGVWKGESYQRRVHHAAWALTRFAANSSFRTIATERSFGTGDDALPPLILPMKDGSRVAVRGTIDRIDSYENGDGIWLRVVDNKSREKKPDPARMATGEQLQLMIYLKAATEAYPGARPAGAMFFPVTDKEISPRETDPAAVEEERMKNVRMKGLVTADPDVITAMDRDIRPYSVDKVFNNDGSVAKGLWWAMDESALKNQMNAAVEKAAELCGEIRDGHVEAAPRGSGDDTACRYCDYRTICHARRGDERPRDK